MSYKEERIDEYTNLLHRSLELYDAQQYSEAEKYTADALAILVTDIYDNNWFNEKSYYIDKAGLLNNYAELLWMQNKLDDVARYFEEAFQIHELYLNESEFVDAKFQTVLNQANFYSVTGNDLAESKYVQAIHLIDKYPQDIEHGISIKANLLLNYGITLNDKSDFLEAIIKYKQSWALFDELPIKEVAYEKTKLLEYYGCSLLILKQLLQAKQKIKEAIDHYNFLDERAKQDYDYGALCRHYANCLYELKEFKEAESFYKIALDFYRHRLKNGYKYHIDDGLEPVALYFITLSYYGSLLAEIKNFKNAFDTFEEALSLFSNQEFNNNPNLHKEKVQLLTYYALALTNDGRHTKANEKFEQAWIIFEKFYDDSLDSLEDKANLLLNHGNTLGYLGRYDESNKMLSLAWDIHQKHLMSKEYLHEERALLLMSHAITLDDQKEFLEADTKYNEALNFHENYLIHRKELAHDRTLILANQAITLRSLYLESADLSYLEKANQNYHQAISIYNDSLYNRVDLLDQKVILLINHLITLIDLKQIDKAIRNCQDAWKILTTKLKNRANLNLEIQTLCNHWQNLWTHMEAPQAWAEEVSDELRRRLDAINHADPPDNIDEIYRLFAKFHIQWMTDSLADGHPERILDILGKISSWRMANATLDELDALATDTNADNTKDANDTDNNQTFLKQYQHIRLKLRQILQQLHEKEQQAGYNQTDNSGLRSSLMQNREPSAELIAQIDALRQQYDTTYNDMLQLQERVADLPGYVALSAKRTDINYKQYQQQLTDNQAMLIVFDQHISVDNTDEIHTAPHLAEDSELNGAILLTKDNIIWQPIDNISTGKQFLEQYEVLIKQTTRTRVYRRSDLSEQVPDVKLAKPMYYQNVEITADNLWDSLGNWIHSTLWQPLLPNLTNIEDIILVTQGSSAHILPWQMHAPITTDHITRLPGLMFAAMYLDLLNKQQPTTLNTDNPAIGIAYYYGDKNPLPLAKQEATIIADIWQQNNYHIIPDYDLTDPQQPVHSVHIAGHGYHSDDTGSNANLTVEKDTTWSLSQLMTTKAKPQQLYISCCLAGRTTDKAGESYGVAAVCLQHGTQQIASSAVSMDDGWIISLSILTNQLQADNRQLSLKQAHYQAQQLLGSGEWQQYRPAIESAWTASMREALYKVVNDNIDNDDEDDIKFSLIEAVETELIAKQPMREKIDKQVIESLKQSGGMYERWTYGLLELQETDSIDERSISRVVDDYLEEFMRLSDWVKQPMSLTMGSLLYGSWVFG